MLERVHMPDAADVMRRYPHQISGGQQQRVVIGMALLNNPALLIMDEPTTALDVTVEAAVLDLIGDLRRDFDTAIMYITHNLGVVARVCNRVGVMYAGEMVERASVDQIFSQPAASLYARADPLCAETGHEQSEQRALPDSGTGAAAEQRGRRGACLGRAATMRSNGAWTSGPPCAQLADGRIVRCHFAEEIDPALWTPPDEAAVPALSQNGSSQEIILDVDGLEKYYPVRGNSLKDVVGIGEKRQVKAVDDVSFAVRDRKYAGHCRRVRLRQEYAGQDDHRSGGEHRRQGRISSAST